MTSTSFQWASYDDRYMDVPTNPEGLKTKLTNRNEHNGNQLVAAEPILASGKHSWLVRILESWNSWGDAMVIGVADATVDINDPKGVKAWGFLPLSGCVHSSANANQPGTKGKQVCEPLCGTATGAIVRVQVDMERRTLAFAVNGGELVDAGVTLSPQVRPHALLCFPKDALLLEVAE